jgi:cytochrome c biogenesis protein CcdA
LLSVALIGAFVWFLGVSQSAAQDGKVRFILFYGETCPHCHDVMDNYLPKVYDRYGDQVEHQYIEVFGNLDNYRKMLGLQTRLGVPEERQGLVPAVVIGDQVLIGAQEIPDRLEDLIDQYLAQGGVDYPSLENLPEVNLPTPEPTVQILVFFDQGHPDFEALNDLVVALGEQYGAGVRVAGVDISDSGNAKRLAELHQAFGLDAPIAGTPEVLLDRQLLVGLPDIEARLGKLIEDLLAQGGATIPSWEELVAAGSGGSATPPASEAPAAAPPIYLAYFEQAGCQECARTAYDLKLVQSEYPQLIVESYPIEDIKNKALNEWLSEEYGVPEEKRLSTPMIFVGDDFLIGEEATLRNLFSTVSKYAATGAERTWAAFDPAQAEEQLIDRFKSFGVLTVAGAGLIDGLNPCAFATLVFFVSYMAFTGRRGRDILLVGIAFAGGVFVTYLLVGLGLLKVVQSLHFFTAVGRWVYLATALMCVILAALSFRDYGRARAGQVGEMTLKLPMGLRRRIHRVIRENSQVRAFLAMAFVTGLIVSLFELACTGQVYLPTIMFVLSVPELAAQAFLYLVLYCLMFIVPLMIVFLLSYFGTSSEQLGRFVQRNTAVIKLATALLFLGLGLWMVWTLGPLFGVGSPWNWLLLAGVVAVVLLATVVLLVRDNHAEEKSAPHRKGSRA